MNRNEILLKLHSLSVAAELVALTYEQALECTYVSSEGTSYEWLSFQEWPAGQFTFTSREEFLRIKNKISQKCLSREDIEGTVLLSVLSEFACCDSDNLNELFYDLSSVDFPDDGQFYMLKEYADDKVKVQFFADYKKFEAAFVKNRLGNLTPWDELSDDDLIEWSERVQSAFGNGIPCFTYE